MTSAVSSSFYCKACGAANPAQATHCSVCREPFTSGATTHPLTGLLLPSILLKQRYRILDVLSTGEVSTLYKVEDVQLGNRIVALKEISSGPLPAPEDSQALAANRREMLLHADLVHPNLPRIYDYFVEDKRWYFVMDLLAGETLEEYLSKSNGKGLPLEEVVDIGIQLSTVLDYLHSRQIPLGFNALSLSNILRTPGGNLYLLDVGAPSQSVSTPAGTPMYSLGMVLRQLLAPPQPPRRGLQQLRSLLPGKTPRHRQSSIIQLLTSQMTTREVKKRPANMAIVRQELQLLAAQESPRTPAKRAFSRRTLLKAGGLTGLGLVCAGLGWIVEYQWQQTTHTLQRSYSPSLGGTIYTYSDSPTNGWLLAVAWSPDGRRVAASGPDPTLQIWDANTGQHVVLCQGHSKTVEIISWSSQNNLIASGSDDFTVRIWDGASGQSRMMYQKHSSPVLAVAWSPDGRHIASGAIGEQVVQVWEAAVGRQVVLYKGHTAGVASVAWSPDGTYIASASFDGTVQIWDAATGRQIFTYTGHTGGVYTVAWSPDGKYIASGDRDATVHVWSAMPTQSGGKLKVLYSGHSDAVEVLAWSPEGTNIASGSNDTTVQLWNGHTGRELYTYKKHSQAVFSLAWSPNGRYIASASKDGTAQVWNAK